MMRERTGENDPFLLQSQGIPLTQRERQEGYDIDLVNSQPRPLPLDEQSYFGAADAQTGGKRRPTSSDLHSNHPPLSTATGTTTIPQSSGAAAGAYGGEKYAQGAYHQWAPAGAGAGAQGAGAGAATQRGGAGGINGRPQADEYIYDDDDGLNGKNGGNGKKKWYLRPLALGSLITLILIVIALAVGLGVGLHKKHNASTSNSANSPLASSGAQSGSASAYRATSTRKTSGTVIPSSLGSISTSAALKATTTPRATATTTIVVNPTSTDSDSESAEATGTSDGADITAATATAVPSPVTVTSKATTGNLPVPATVATTIGGTTYSALATAREKRRRKRF
ncbi:hypothetical protein T439DRAFT_327538 [Meredithblackwellia eburnea MCA 4105]